MSAPTSAEVLTLLADSHIRLYGNMLEAAARGAAGIRAGECEHYMGIWRSIRAKAESGALLSAVERGELMDAIFSGDYDHIVPLPEGVDDDGDHPFDTLLDEDLH